ncbi:MAG: hypothetical protein EOM80_01705 [Erysipelotrichia bacterium]|nr:hypothetical protein [Candidatus Riflebacteria bacterium]NCB37458.1 hypothetical protein [Erysipelotrichia bacterium]
MNDMELCAAEFEVVSQNTVLDKHFASNAVGYCDLFETQLYKECWHNLQDAENTIFNSTIEQLISNATP